MRVQHWSSHRDCSVQKRPPPVLRRLGLSCLADPRSGRCYLTLENWPSTWHCCSPFSLLPRTWVECLLSREAGLVTFNAVILFVLFLFLPLLYTWYRRVDMVSTFRLSEGVGLGEPIWKRTARWIGYVAGVVLLSAALWMVAFEAYLLFEGWSLASQLSEEDKERLKVRFFGGPLLVGLADGGCRSSDCRRVLFPRICFVGVSIETTAFRSVLFTSMLFGLFHVIAGSVLSIEKFLPTIILGVVIGYVAIRTGSLFPGILLHALHNGLVFSMSRFTEQDLARWFGEDTKHIPVIWLCGGALSMALGAVVLFLSSQRNQTHEDSN